MSTSKEKRVDFGLDFAVILPRVQYSETPDLEQHNTIPKFAPYFFGLFRCLNMRAFPFKRMV